MAPEPTLPVQLHVAGRRCVVVGAGTVGARRAATLAAAGAQVVVVATDVGSDARALVDDASVELVVREFRHDDLDGALLVVTATDSEAVNSEVAAAAGARQVLVNRADLGPAGDLSFPAVVEHGPLRLAVSTGGDAPAVTSWIAGLVGEGIEALVALDADALTLLVDLAAEIRAEERSARDDGTGVTSGPLDWRSALDGSILELIREGRRAEAKERLRACR